jgi:hypothetical protein
MVCQLRVPAQSQNGDVTVECVPVNEVEMDEMWSFAGTNPGSIGYGEQQTIIQASL